MKPAHTRPSVQFERRGPAAPRTPFKPKAFNHQDDLKDAVGKQVVLVTLRGTTVEGELLGADQFTIKIRRCDVESKSVLTWFKHALASYGVKG